MIEKDKVNRILVVSLNNLGDVILTFPVIDILCRDFPKADISVVLGAKSRHLLVNNPNIKHLLSLPEKGLWKERLRWLAELRKERFDLVVDLKHTLIPAFLMPRYSTPLIRFGKSDKHVIFRYLDILKAVHPADQSDERFCFHPTDHDLEEVQNLLSERLNPGERSIVLAPGSANHRKRWTEDGFAQIADWLTQAYRFRVIFTGSPDEAPIIERIQAKMTVTAVNLCGQINFHQLGVVFKQCVCALVNDSSPMHFSSYLNVPTLGLFGPSNPLIYGPWSENSSWIRVPDGCEGCRRGDCDYEHTCMSAITVDQVKEKLIGILTAIGAI